MVRIESRYIRIRSGIVVKYRRIVTPFFYVKIKPITYTRKTYDVIYFSGTLLPEKLHHKSTRWFDEKGNIIINDIEKCLDVANESQIDNVLRISA